MRGLPSAVRAIESPVSKDRKAAQNCDLLFCILWEMHCRLLKSTSTCSKNLPLPPSPSSYRFSVPSWSKLQACLDWFGASSLVLGIDSSRLLTGTGQKWIGTGWNGSELQGAEKISWRSSSSSVGRTRVGFPSHYHTLEAIANDGNMVKDGKKGVAFVYDLYVDDSVP